MWVSANSTSKTTHSQQLKEEKMSLFPSSLCLTSPGLVEGREREWLVGISQHGNVSKAYYDRTFRRRKKKKKR